jgi:dienelactone hydrolase
MTAKAWSRTAPSAPRVREQMGRAWRSIAPGRRAWRGAAGGVLAGTFLIALVAAYTMFAAGGAGRLVAGGVVFVASLALAGTLLALLLRLLGAIPRFYMWALSAALVFLVVFTVQAVTAAPGVLAVAAALIITLSLVGASVAVLGWGRWRHITRVQRGVAGASFMAGFAGLAFMVVWLLQPGAPLAPPVNAARASGALVPQVTLPDPSLAGRHTVRSLCYGSAYGRWSESCPVDRALVTAPVDGSALVDGWSSLRARYWGFGPEAMPLNGRVWYPEGEGPFPLVLVVHGNAMMEELSDPGYAYLGDLLASRGFIVASVDSNFLNLSPFADLLYFRKLQGEVDARAWLLLEHLRQWHDWNELAGNPFYQLVDVDNIALVGHSRGGEAVAIAAFFNDLPYYPDNAAVTFDYSFNIRSLVAIAPSDGLYKPGDASTPVQNVSYLVIHGTHDMDVVTFMGARQYSRVGFTSDDFNFKAALYVYGANHGQFNTVWGRTDLDAMTMSLFNLRQLMPGAEQEQVARVYISAFLDATLRDERGYLPLFRDYRAAPGWLPETLYLNQYSDSSTRWLSTYEEDLDLSTTSLTGGSQRGEHLTVWREQLVPARWGDMDNRAVYLGWDGTARPDALASYSIDLPEAALETGPDSVLVFDVADAGEPPNPDAESESSLAQEPLDFTVELLDRQGTVVRLPLSSFSLLQPRLETTLTKARFMFVLPPSEIVLQSFQFPLSEAVAANPAFDPAAVTGIRFVFDRSPSGVIVLDNVGVR